MCKNINGYQSSLSIQGLQRLKLQILSMNSFGNADLFDKCTVRSQCFVNHADLICLKDFLCQSFLVRIKLLSLFLRTISFKFLRRIKS